MMKNIALAAFAAAIIVAPLGADAAPLSDMARSLRGPASYLPLKSPTLAPFSHVRFCVENPAYCQKSGSASMVTLSGDKSNELQRINRHVNSAIRAVNDEDSPLGDVWQSDVASGDCEDFVLTKQRKLIALGWPSGALRIAVARTGSGQGHAVLVVKTSQGDLVLDNRTNKIRPWNRVGLQWVKIQSGDNPRLWFNL